MNLNNEANLQAEFYHQCRLIGLRCHLEVTSPVGRLDCVVMNKRGSRFLAIIEAKPSSKIVPTEQLERYRSLGVPVFLLTPEICPKALALLILTDHMQPGVTVKAIKAMRNLREQTRARRILLQSRRSVATPQELDQRIIAFALAKQA